MVRKIIDVLKYIFVIVILFFSGYGVYSLISGGDELKNEVIKVETKYIHVTDTIQTYKPFPVKKYITVSDTVIVTEKEFIEVYRELTEDERRDIAEEYFTKKTYSDTLVVEGYGNIFLEDELWKNNIFSRKYSYDFSIPLTKETVEFIPQRLNLYLGSEINYLIKDPSFTNNTPLSPRAFLGAEYRIGKSHYIEASYDPIWGDVRLGYDYRKDNLEIGAKYSTGWSYLTLEGRYYITK